MSIKLVTGMTLVFTAVLALCGSLTCHAGPEFFFTSGISSATGDVLGTDIAGNPKDWKSVHSQVNGSSDANGSLRFGNAKGANWIFLWSRAAGDTKTYKVVPTFNIYKEFAGKVVLEYGLDPVYHHTQTPWPNGFWVSNDSSWCPQLDVSADASGNMILNKKGKSFIVPSDMKKLYIRVRLADDANPGFVHLNSGAVKFDAVSDEAADAVVPTSVSGGVIEAGADPTGKHDSTAAIQASLDKGGLVYLPSGIYKISRTLMIRKSYTDIRGEAGTILKVAEKTPITGISVSDAEGVWRLHDINISNISLVNDPSNYKAGENLQGTRGIELNGVVDCRVQNCSTQNFQHEGIAILYCKNVVVDACNIQGARHGITINGNYEGGRYGNWNIRIANCKTSDTFDTGIVVGFYSYYITLANNIVERSRCHGIDIFNVSDVTLTGNIVRNWNAPKMDDLSQVPQSVGIFVHPDWGITTFVPTRNIILTGNIVIYDQPLDAGITPNCIEVAGNCDSVVITGNTVIGAFRGFVLREQPYDQYFNARLDKRVQEKTPMSPQNVVFSNNVVRGQTGEYLQVSSGKTITSVISGNIFAPAKTGVMTINVPVNNSNVSITGNTFQDGHITADWLPRGAAWGLNSVRMFADTSASEEFVK